MEAPEEQSRIQILPRFHVQNEAVRVLKMGVAQQGYVGCIGPIAPGLGACRDCQKELEEVRDLTSLLQT
ncbi:hypothetical protein E5288_WYG022124 [Bos mutus]|nr:hypothetical protein [Bos mutus]